MQLPYSYSVQLFEANKLINKVPAGDLMYLLVFTYYESEICT